MAILKKMECEMVFFGEKVPWTVTTKKMDDDKEDGMRNGIFWGKSAMDGDDKEDGWRQR